MLNFNFDILVVLGATATGKTSLAVELAKKYEGEIISADSRQVYRGMDIGSGKDIHEYGEVKYHLIDIVEPSEEYHLFNYQADCFKAIATINSHSKLPILAGGTGLYLDSVLDSYEMIDVPENIQLRLELAELSDDQLRAKLFELNSKQHNTTDCIDRNRLYRAIEIAAAKANAVPSPVTFPQLAALNIGIQWERKELHKKIDARLNERFKAGMIEEVVTLHKNGVSYQTLELKGLEYRLIALYLQGKLNHNDMKQKLASSIKKFAKRQDTWFRRMERKGHVIHWVAGNQNPFEAACKIIDKNNKL